MEQSETKRKQKKSDKKKILWLSAASVVVVALIIGLSYAWFFDRSDMATLVPIKPPSDIAILGPNGSELTSLDLNYTDADKDANGKVTIRRVFCVQSQAEYHKLEIVHTTNMKGVTFQLYAATAADSSNESGSNIVTDGGYTYKYNPDSPISGSYINADNEKPTEQGYKYANDSKHSVNYGGYSNVQVHAEPLYWLVNESLKANDTKDIQINDKFFSRTYYVLEISWTETTKETDIFYILAKDVNEGQ